MLQRLVETVTSHTEIVKSLGRSAPTIADSATSTDSEVLVSEVIVYEARVENTLDVEYHGNASMARELGRDIPILTESNFTLWKKYVLAYGRATVTELSIIS